MAAFIAKRLAKIPIGTHVELTCTDGDDKIRGIVTDSDFSAHFEVIGFAGEENVVDYSLVQGYTVTKTLVDILKEIPEGTKICFSYGADTNREPNCNGTVIENDHEEGVAILTDSGEELALEYPLIRSILIKGKQKQPVVRDTPSPKKREPLYSQTPEDILNASDYTLDSFFDQLPREERKKLNGPYDSFRHGIKNNDSEKKIAAANLARLTLFREEDQGFVWSREAARFCGALLRRVNEYDYDVYLVSELFNEAAFACWKTGKHDLAGAFATLSILKEKPENLKDLAIILSTAVVKANDATALPILYKHMPAGFEDLFRQVIEDALDAKSISNASHQDLPAILELLKQSCPGTSGAEMGDEVEYWFSENDTQSTPTAVQEQQKPVEPVTTEPVQKNDEPQCLYGIITWLNWSERTGTIKDEDGNSYTFRYQDIKDDALSKIITTCMRGNLDGKVYRVQFMPDRKFAREVQREIGIVDRGRAICADTTRADRFEVAFELCKGALDSSDYRRAITDMVKYALTLHTSKQKSEYLQEAMTLYEPFKSKYQGSPFEIMNIAQCYGYLKNYSMMLEHATRAVVNTRLNVYQRIALVSQYLKMVQEYYDVSGDKSLLQQMVLQIEILKTQHKDDLSADPKAIRPYSTSLLPYLITANCALDQLDAAQEAYAQLPMDYYEREYIDKLMVQTRARLAPEPAPVQDEDDETVETDNPVVIRQEIYEPVAEEDEMDEEITDYVDNEGWQALGLSKKAVIDYALSIRGDDRIPSILAYLGAAASMNPQIEAVYRVIALAANDPMCAPEYSITALEDALMNNDADYPELNDCCMYAAFLRSSFLSGRGYDFSTAGLRSSIAVPESLAVLESVYETLEEFRKEAECAIDIYADYRNHGVKQLKAEIDSTVRRAKELYTKYIETPKREIYRVQRTADIIFARDGDLATMLSYIAERNNDALLAQRDHFVATYLGGVPQFSVKQVSDMLVDDIISQAWDQAGKQMSGKKKINDPLQGDRRNNMRSNIFDVLGIICQWYALSEQSAGLTWRTEKGQEAYQRIRPKLMAQLTELSQACQAEVDNCSNDQNCTGLFLLSATAKELVARLDGSWKFEQERYLYIDFLRSNRVMLNTDFLPELSSTFCVLPAFNILARIRQHVEGEKYSFQEQIDRIYGMDKTCNNYGTAARIQEYLEAIGESEAIVLPENAPKFVSQTEAQIDMRYRRFRETYALAMNQGQINKSDLFCHTLENTVRYWRYFCRKTKNYGFFTAIVQEAEEYIHISAKQYEDQLNKQLDALIVGNQQYFDSHPDYAEVIRNQITCQNFTVAEDWMSRIRIGDFSLNVEQPEALEYLADFWLESRDIYDKVFDTTLPLKRLIEARDLHTNDHNHALQLIEDWMDAEQIERLLRNLGWPNFRVRPYKFAAEPRGEFYEVRKESTSSEMTAPLHPIAAFGSTLEKRRMYVACLRGTYDCDRLYEKMRAFDEVDGSKVFLVDDALGQTDRRALARKLKMRESSLRNVNIVIDRVLLTYLAIKYNSNLINRILMATAMPFSYCQPYVVESIHTMPPEIFIGRKDELLKIEQPDGVNLIYGGRQLGKSALFKKALADIDGREMKRAVLIDINKLDCASAARKISEELIDLDITPNVEPTDDWSVLSRNITRSLRSASDQISYFLLMLDEADAFIEDCANCGYRPLVELKDIQQSLQGQFKYVLAGLHNIVKFNRQVALGNNSVITHMPSLKITPFHTPEAQELLIHPMSYLGFSLPDKVDLSQILATCNYFPGLIQLYAKKLLETVRGADYAGYDVKKTPPYVVSVEQLRRVTSDKEFMDEIYRKFEITLTLDQDQGSCYYPLALLISLMYGIMPSESGYTAKDVLEQAKDFSVYPLADLNEEKINALMQELQDLNILRSVSDNSYLLTSKNFRDLLGSVDEIFEKLRSMGGVPV